MEKKFSLALMPIIMICLFNAGYQSTEKNEPEPAVNFMGTINGEPAENITISGLYEHIPFYYVPSAPDAAPTGHVAHRRLDDIKAIRRTGDKPIEQFQKRDYVHIEIEFVDGTKQPFLIERSRKIDYSVPFSDPKIKSAPNEMNFGSLNELTIASYKQRPRGGNEKRVLEKSAAKEALCTQAKKNIALLEQNSSESFKPFIAKIKEATTLLCS